MINLFSRSYADQSVSARGIDLLHRAANKVSTTSLLRVIALIAPIPEVWETGAARYRYVTLGDRELLRYAEDPAADMTAEFVADACRRGHRCYAALDGDVLASYQWCSTKLTRVNDRLLVTVPPGWTYKYKALTLDRYRGQRLHACLSSIMQGDAARNGHGLFACVEINNWPSLISFARMGAVHVGTLAAASMYGRNWTHGSRGCRRLGIGLVRRPAPISRSPLPYSAVSGR